MKKFIFISAFSICTLLTACGEDVGNQDANQAVAQQEESTVAASKEVVIPFASSSEAVDFLRKELGMETNEDIVFDDLGGSLQEDAYSSYYEIILYSKGMQAAGGSGTVGIYKVYVDGTYEARY